MQVACLANLDAAAEGWVRLLGCVGDRIVDPVLQSFTVDFHVRTHVVIYLGAIIGLLLG
jgi:hypothetical protein